MAIDGSLLLLLVYRAVVGRRPAAGPAANPPHRNLDGDAGTLGQPRALSGVSTGRNTLP
jgi:hypothetical protein